MAIDDNILYGLTGSQVKDLADKVVQASDEVINIGNLNNFVTGNSAHQELLIKIANAALKHDVAVMQVYGTAFRAPTRPAYIKENGNFRQLTWSLTSLDNSSSSSSTLGVGYNIRDSYTWTFYVLPSEVTAGEITHVYGRYSGTDPTSASSYTDSTVTPSASTYDRTYTVSASGRGDIVGKDNVNQWTPTTDYGLVHKKYVDDKIQTSSTAPTTSTVGTVGQLLTDTTNGELYQCTAVDTTSTPAVYTWENIAPNGLQFKTLTDADVNFPLDNPSTVSLWRLPTGVYTSGSDSVTMTLDDYTGGYYNAAYKLTPGKYAVVVHTPVNNNVNVYIYSSNEGVASGQVNSTTGESPAKVIGPSKLAHNLTTTDEYAALGAAQGRLLNQKIEGRVMTGSGVPTTSTVGTVGGLYENTTNGNVYICTTASGGIYTWERLAKVSELPNFTMTTTDPGEGQPLADNNFIAVYAA